MHPRDQRAPRRGGEPLSPALGAAAGADTGVMVNMVDAAGPAADVLAPTDVIDTIDGRAIRSIDDWRARTLRLAAGDSVSLQVRSAGQSREVRDYRDRAITPRQSTPRMRAPPSGADSLGLQLAAVINSGSRVVRVQPGSSAAHAALQPGDLITAVGRQTKPIPSQVTRAFAALPAGESLIVAFTREIPTTSSRSARRCRERHDWLVDLGHAASRHCRRTVWPAYVVAGRAQSARPRYRDGPRDARRVRWTQLQSAAPADGRISGRVAGPDRDRDDTGGR